MKSANLLVSGPEYLSQETRNNRRNTGSRQLCRHVTEPLWELRDPEGLVRGYGA